MSNINVHLRQKQSDDLILATKELIERLVTNPVTIKGLNIEDAVITLCATMGRGYGEIAITAEIIYGSTIVDYYIGGEYIEQLDKATLLAVAKQQSESLLSTIR